MTERATAYWCTRGGLFTMVHAATEDRARDKAARAMGRTTDGIRCRRARPTDRALWADLLEQQERGAEGCRQDRPESVQPAMFAA